MSHRSRAKGWTSVTIALQQKLCQYHLFLRACELIRTDFKETTWKAFWRVVVDGVAAKDVAEELSMQPGAVRVAKSRVLQRLRQEMGELLE